MMKAIATGHVRPDLTLGITGDLMTGFGKAIPIITDLPDSGVISRRVTGTATVKAIETPIEVLAIIGGFVDPTGEQSPVSLVTALLLLYSAAAFFTNSSSV
jgi:hypothetical protein